MAEKEMPVLLGKSPLQFGGPVDGQILDAVQMLQGNKGASLKDIKRFLCSDPGLDMKLNAPELNIVLKNSLRQGTLLKDAGNYKVREAKRRRRSKSASGGRRRRRSRSGGKSGRRKSSGRKGSSGKRRRRRKKAAAAEA